MRKVNPKNAPQVKKFAATGYCTPGAAKQLGEEAIAYAHEIKVYALRKLGEMLKATPKNTGAMGIGTSAVPIENRTPTYADIGLDKKVASLAAQIAALPMEKVEAVAKRALL